MDAVSRNGSALSQSGARLLHAQCWLWGQDLHSPAGDLLRAVGPERGERESAPAHRTYYVDRLEGGRFAVAWSGGLLFGDPSLTGNSGDALLFPRLRFAPIALDDVRAPPDVRDLDARLRVGGATAPPATGDTSGLDVPGLDARIRAAIAWLASYEDRAVAIAGADWRARCAAVWAETEVQARTLAAAEGVEYTPLPPLPRAGLAGAWRDLAGMTSIAAP